MSRFHKWCWASGLVLLFVMGVLFRYHFLVWKKTKEMGEALGMAGAPRFLEQPVGFFKRELPSVLRVGMAVSDAERILGRTADSVERGDGSVRYGFLRAPNFPVIYVNDVYVYVHHDGETITLIGMDNS